jgi:hypothetical protein
MLSNYYVRKFSNLTDLVLARSRSKSIPTVVGDFMEVERFLTMIRLYFSKPTAAV